jgi:L-asparaginase/Glu-tRNA(Gln) amidotransferase subunit D
MTSAFLSHNWDDKPFVRRLAADLERYGVRVWIDETEIRPGESLIRKISHGIHKSQYCIAVLSSHSVGSPWVQKELELAMTLEVQGRVVKVIPVVIDECQPPDFLTGKLLVDFRKQSYDKNLRAVLRGLGIDLSAVKIGTGVLVIYTGGGIGMIGGRAGDKPVGLRPARMEKLIGSMDWRNYRVPKVDYITFSTPMDSSNMGPHEWAELCKLINNHYHSYEGFVILHGFDTVDYAAATLSFMMSNIGKPIVFTGSKVPMEYEGSRAEKNLQGALSLAAGASMKMPTLPGVMVYRNEHVLHPLRVTFSSLDESWAPLREAEERYISLGTYDGYKFTLKHAPAFLPPAGELEVNTDFATDYICEYAYVQNASLDGIAYDTWTREYKAAIVVNMHEGVRAINDRVARSILEQSAENGILTIVLDNYPGVFLGQKPKVTVSASGIIACNNLTLAAASSKLASLFGRNSSVQKVRELFLRNDAGEYMGNPVGKLMGAGDE